MLTVGGMKRVRPPPAEPRTSLGQDVGLSSHAFGESWHNFCPVFESLLRRSPFHLATTPQAELLTWGLSVPVHCVF